MTTALRQPSPDEAFRPSPALYVEPCQPGEDVPDLTVEEFSGPLLSAWNSCRGTWTRIAPDAGRELEHVSFRADPRDADLLEPYRWHLADELGGPPAARAHLRPWAVEFPDGGRWLRRRFWFASRFPVPPAR